MNHPVISKQDTPNKRFVYKALEQLHTRSIQLNWLSRTGGKQKSSYIFPMPAGFTRGNPPPDPLITHPLYPVLCRALRAGSG